MLRTKDFQVFFNDFKLEYATSSEIDLIPIIEKLFNEMYQENIIYRSSGIHVYELEDKEKIQLSLFSNKEKEKSSKIASVIDKIEYKYGKGNLALGNNGIKTIMKKHTRKQIQNLF